MNAKLVQKLKLPKETSNGPIVQIANGDRMSCGGRCSAIKIEFPGYATTSEFFILQLEEIDIVLGIQWLKTLGPILWDFESLTMSFKDKDKTVELRGQITPPDQLCDKKRISQSFKQRKQGLLMNFQVVNSRGLGLPETTLTAQQQDGLDQLLLRFDLVFSIPKGLLPTRPHDHHVNLKEGTMPVAVRPYRYPYFQKNEIERQVKQLLEDGVIQPTSSPYSAPVLLVKKKDGS